MHTPEDAVRNYLTAIKNPKALIDQSKIKALNEKIATSNDPIEQATLITQCERAEQVDLASLEPGFVEHAQSVAESADISATSLQSLGVSPDVLTKAGFKLDPKKKSSGTRRSRTSISQIRDRLPATPFSNNDLVELTGGAKATVTKAIEAFKEEGLIKSFGTDPDWSGRGRAPELFSKI